MQGKEIRCNKCNRLLGIFEYAKGEIKCPRCKSVEKVKVKDDVKNAIDK